MPIPKFKDLKEIPAGAPVDEEIRVEITNMLGHILETKSSFIQYANCDNFKKSLIKDLVNLSNHNNEALKVNFDVIKFNNYNQIKKDEVYFIIKDYYDRDGFNFSNSQVYQNINNSSYLKTPWLLLQYNKLKEEEFKNINEMKRAHDERELKNRIAKATRVSKPFNPINTNNRPAKHPQKTATTTPITPGNNTQPGPAHTVNPLATTSQKPSSKKSTNNKNEDDEMEISNDVESAEEPVYMDANRAKDMNDKNIAKNLNNMVMNQIQNSLPQQQPNQIGHNASYTEAPYYPSHESFHRYHQANNGTLGGSPYRPTNFGEMTRNGDLKDILERGISDIRMDMNGVNRNLTQKINENFQATSASINKNTETCNTLSNNLATLTNETLPSLEARVINLEKKKPISVLDDTIIFDGDSFGDEEGEPEVGREIAKSRAVADERTYDKYLNEVQDDCELELTWCNNEFINNAHDANTASTNMKKVERFLQGRFKEIRTIYNSKSHKYISIIKASYPNIASRKKACEFAFELRKHGRTKNIMGINYYLRKGDTYNKDSTFKVWKKCGLIKEFARSSSNRYFITLNDDARIFVPCPKLMSTLRKDQITTENLKKLKVKGEYFIGTDQKIHISSKLTNRPVRGLEDGEHDGNEMVDEESSNNYSTPTKKATNKHKHNTNHPKPPHKPTQFGQKLNHEEFNFKKPEDRDEAVKISKPKKRRMEEPGPSNGNYQDQDGADTQLPISEDESNYTSRNGKNRITPNKYYVPESRLVRDSCDYISLSGEGSSKEVQVISTSLKDAKKSKEWEPKGKVAWVKEDDIFWSQSSESSKKRFKDRGCYKRNDNNPYVNHYLKTDRARELEKMGYEYNKVHPVDQGYLLNGKIYEHYSDARAMRSFLPYDQTPTKSRNPKNSVNRKSSDRKRNSSNRKNNRDGSDEEDSYGRSWGRNGKNTRRNLFSGNDGYGGNDRHRNDSGIRSNQGKSRGFMRGGRR